MTWYDPNLQPIIDQAKKMIEEYFSCQVTSKVFLCTLEELQNQMIDEFKDILKTALDKEVFQFTINNIEGRFIKNRNEIWLVSQRGENLDTQLNEYIHSIQQCTNHREDIVKFLTYKLTAKENVIETELLDEWLEIENQEGLKKIKDQLLQSGDCEDF